MVDLVFAELVTGRRREVMSAVAHYIAGVLDRESMVEIVESLSKSADLKPGDRVKTLRGSTRGVIVRVWLMAGWLGVLTAAMLNWLPCRRASCEPEPAL